METSETVVVESPAPEAPAAPAAPVPHENTLKARRFVERFVTANTEAVIVIKKNGRYAIMDMQKPGAYQMRPDELLNERWREVLPRPAKPPVDKSKAVAEKKP